MTPRLPSTHFVQGVAIIYEDMHKSSEKAVQELRRRVADSKQALSNMAAQFKHPYFQGQIRLANSELDEIETLFLASLDREERTPAQEAKWIANAEFVFREILSPKVKRLQDILAKYGPDVIAMPY